MNDSSDGKRLYDGMLSEHRVILLQIADLKEWWFQRDELGDPNYEEMSSRLRQLQDLLDTHFREEEKDGYLETALNLAPRFAQEAEELRLQHADFIESLEKFSTRLAASSTDRLSWQQVRDEFDEIVERLRKHETAETKIIQSAFSDDLGVGD